MNRIAITGLGVICSAGNNVNEFFHSLDNPNFKGFTSNPRIKLNISVSVYEADSECFKDDSVNKTFDSPTGRLCIKAARECLDDYRNSGGMQTPDGLVVGSSTGGQYNSERCIFSILKNEPTKPINFPTEGLIASSTRAIADDLDIEGRIMTVSTACTSSANAIAIGGSLIERGVCKCVIAGGGDALCATTIAGFHILKLTGLEKCRPFGPNRPGLTLGEGAAFFVLEPLEDVIKNGRKYYAELLGYGMNSDAYHMTAPNETGEGIISAMEMAMKRANLTPKDINFLNAHGTGTQLNDKTEALAVKKLFGNIPISSLKGLVGHTLGGAGSIEAVASIYSILRSKAFENFNSYECGEDCEGINIVPKGGLELKKSPIVMSNSFAFGGNNCCLIFGKVDNR
jgi:3-oxoacyl-[acyl-carrier-protein] synthase-1